MPIIHIDNKPFQVKAGKNLLEACLSLGIDLPYFCWHPAMGSVGACRQCAVIMYKDENDHRGRIVMSCMEGVKEGLRISVDDSTAKIFREQVIEWLMTNHPHDCPVCDEGGCCHLQDMTVMTGHDYRKFRYKKRTHINQYLGPFIHHEMNRCIQCYRCVRYYHDYAGGEDLNVFGAHNHVYFGREKDGVLESPFSGNLVEVCPTGVFTDKTLREHYTRKWDLTMSASVCHHCSVGCNITAGERYGELRCVTNRYNGEVNGYFLCDRGRFGYEFVNSENRISQPIIRNQLNEAVDDVELAAHVQSMIQGRKLIGIGSPRASVETNFALMELVEGSNFFSGLSDVENDLSNHVATILREGGIRTPSLKEIEQSDAVIILGEDIWNTAPVMALSVRQAVMNTAANEAQKTVQLPSWNDAAIRELVQDKKGFLANLTVAGSELDSIATYSLQAAPDDVAAFAAQLAGAIQEPAVNITGPGKDSGTATSAMAAHLANVANLVNQGQTPIIISGVGCWNKQLIDSAYLLADALKKAGKNVGLAYVLPEVNSLGLAMMNPKSIENNFQNIDENACVVIAENDLYEHLPASIADSFLNKFKNIIALDHLHNKTTEKASVLVPASTFAEADGTVINFEGRAQHFYQVFVPRDRRVKESWKWLWKFKTLQSQTNNGKEHHPDELLQSLEMRFNQFEGISGVAPTHDFRIHGQRIPRETHRYSGRTAILAGLNVSEPKPLQDNDSALSFTMEGYRGKPPSSMIPFFWAPGWNSNQSVHKYQEEAGGALKDGDPGIRLFDTVIEEKTAHEGGSSNGQKTRLLDIGQVPQDFIPKKGSFLLLPQYTVFGSEPLSMYTAGIAELAPEPYIAISKSDADEMNLHEAAPITIKGDQQYYSLPVKVHSQLPKGIAMIPKAFEGLRWGNFVEIAGEREGSQEPGVASREPGERP